MNEPGDPNCAPALQGPDGVTLARMVTRVFGHWHLSDTEQAGLLGPPTAEDCLDRFRAVDVGHVDRSIEDRVGQLWAIRRLLRVLFPANRDIAYRWPTTPNRSFQRKTPVAVMQEQGMPGLLRVRSYL